MLSVIELRKGLMSAHFVNKAFFFLLPFPQHNTMESLLERGEKLDDLVSKSEVLGTQSKAFYKTVSTGPLLRAPLQRAVEPARPLCPLH